MSEFSVPTPLRTTLEAMASRRRDPLLVIAVVAVVVGGGLALWARGAPPSIAPPATSGPAPEASAGSGGPVVVVHVAGAVRRPGLIQLVAGARVADAIEAAGGALPRADLDLLNLAALVIDGSQVLVPSGGPHAVSASAPVSATPDLVSLNTADQAALETVPGLGPVKAGAIVAFRTEIGGFTSIDQLLEVTGIGPATLGSIRPFVSL